MYQYYVWLSFGNVLLPAKEYPEHFYPVKWPVISISLCLVYVLFLSFSVPQPPFMSWDKAQNSPLLQISLSDQVLIYTEMFFWVETKWMFDTNNLFWERGKTDSVSDNCPSPSQRQILLVLPYGVSYQWWASGPQALCPEQVGQQNNEAALSTASALDLFLSLPLWLSASVGASACAVVEVSLCWLAHGPAKGLSCI